MRYLYLIFALLFGFTSMNYADSDLEKADSLIQEAFELQNNPKEANQYLDKAIKTLDDSDNIKLLSEAYMYRGLTELDLANYSSSIYYFLLAEKYNDDEGMSVLINTNLGGAFFSLKQYRISYNYYNKALKLVSDEMTKSHILFSKLQLAYYLNDALKFDSLIQNDLVLEYNQKRVDKLLIDRSLDNEEFDETYRLITNFASKYLDDAESINYLKLRYFLKTGSDSTLHYIGVMDTTWQTNYHQKTLDLYKAEYYLSKNNFEMGLPLLDSAYQYFKKEGIDNRLEESLLFKLEYDFKRGYSKELNNLLDKQKNELSMVLGNKEQIESELYEIQLENQRLYTIISIVSLLIFSSILIFVIFKIFKNKLLKEKTKTLKARTKISNYRAEIEGDLNHKVDDLIYQYFKNDTLKESKEMRDIVEGQIENVNKLKKIGEDRDQDIDIIK